MDSKNLKKILIVGFEKKNQINYPHLKQTINYLEKSFNCDYSYFPERGYFLNCNFSFSLRKNFTNILSFCKFFLAFNHVIYTKLTGKYQTIIAIDNFTYVIYSLFFKDTILWSHDFVTNDQEQAQCYIQRLLNKLVYKYLNKNKKIIIQDSERLLLFAENYIKKETKSLDVFYFPVSLLPVRSNRKDIDINLPLLMQIGGINRFRSGSDVLINYYQTANKKFDLLLHGYFMNDIIEQINKSNYIPISSTLELQADEVYKIVEKCDIGFICYNTDNKNFYYTKHASGQLVEFLRCSKPVIIIGNTDLKDFVLKEKIGVSIENITDLGEAINEIKNNYLLYQKNVRRCFQRIYDINLYLDSLAKWIYA